MKTSSNRILPGLVILALVSGTVASLADIQVRLSVKFIHSSNGTAPAGGISTSIGFGNEVTRGNSVLVAAGRGYKLVVVEYLDIQPPAPPGMAADYWFTLDARSNRQTFENAALADTTTWRWNANAINIYVNNSSSGQCSLVGQGGAISLGGSVGAGTVLHEVGHVFDLLHTHAGDYSDNNNAPPYILRDGDGLTETAPDNPNIPDHDQLSQALYGLDYSAATAQQQAVVDSDFENVMSYHNENRLLSDQMDKWTLNANGARVGFCSGRTWFVAIGGSDSSSGASASSPLATVAGALAKVSSQDDVVLLLSGSFGAPSGGIITTPCTLRAKGGTVTLHR